MTLHTIDRPPSLVEKVSQSLATLVRSETHGENTRLPTERELATQLGVSRSVIREATKRLEQQGLLEIRHGLGIHTVNRLHKPLTDTLHILVPDEMDRLRQLLELRLIVEPENARLAAERATEDQIIALRLTHDLLVNAKTPADSVAADMDFHRLLAVATGNQITALILHSLSDLLQASLNRGYRRVTPYTAIHQHHLIIAAIENREPDAAADITRQHLLSARTDLSLDPASPSAP
jgi:DNA-binding FadR family transcriptional regulator